MAPLQQADLPEGNAEGFGEKAQQALVGLAIDGWCRDANFQPRAVHTDSLFASGARLQMAVDDELIIVPVIMIFHLQL